MEKVTPECGHCVHAKLHLIDLKKKKKSQLSVSSSLLVCAILYPPPPKKKKLCVSSHLTGPIFSISFFPTPWQNKTNKNL